MERLNKLAGQEENGEGTGVSSGSKDILIFSLSLCLSRLALPPGDCAPTFPSAVRIYIFLINCLQINWAKETNRHSLWTWHQNEKGGPNHICQTTSLVSLEAASKAAKKQPKQSASRLTCVHGARLKKSGRQRGSEADRGGLERDEGKGPGKGVCLQLLSPVASSGIWHRNIRVSKPKQCKSNTIKYLRHRATQLAEITHHSWQLGRCYRNYRAQL